MPPRSRCTGARAAVWRWLQANTFAPPWLPARWRHLATGYVLVVLLQVTAAIFTRLLIGFFSAYSFPGLVELLIVALMALSFGSGPALFATLLGVALEELVVLPVRIGEGQFDLGDLLEIALFLAVGVSISVVASATEASRQRALKERAEAQARELAAIRQAQEHMDEFLAIASHDLRTPVTATAGFIEIAARWCERLAVMAQGEKPDLVRLVERVRGSVRDARQSVERLSRLVTLLFDISQARAGKLELNRTLCDLAALARDQVDVVRVSAPERAIRLRVSANDPVWVVADADRVGQVITNYLSNALKYSPDDQAVDVRVAVAGGWACVAVEDRGPGLPPDELGRIWQPFHRVAGVAAQSGASSGLGMGLHISKTIVEAHGGRVGVESAVGCGSTFWFALPVAEQTT
jgi:signal transduction histidine kinase